MKEEKRERITEEELNNLIKELKQEDKISRNTLINYYMPTAKRIASEYFGLGLEKEDVISSAYEGLILGINKLEKSESDNIFNKIYHNIRRTIEINIAAFYGVYFNEKEERYVPLAEKIISVLKAQKHLKRNLHHNPSVEEISAYLGLSKEIIIVILNIITPKKSLEYEELQTLKNELLNLEEQTLENLIIEEFKSLMKICLNEQKLKVAYLQYIEKLNIREIAAILNVSHARIGIIEDKIRSIINELIELIKNEDYSKIKNLEFQRKTIKEIINLASNGNKDAFNYLYEHYIPLAERVAKPFYNLEIPKEIILSFAYKGLNKGLTKIIKSSDIDIHKKLARYIIKEIKENLEKYGILLNKTSKSKKLTIK